eukprot:CAMPEP_0184377074 /NCGR_PEP_ID=MMETSP0007-20130409/1961_1 /TAXON_ID=97485 /ORGANISM="Prymnesium parvum, Strain Texoma1" /LENGTH=98 /DNA_ID=CAMNT_0026720833 /DNA_START=18 /DNA_END=311 /DNA_ORIENTATION=+
MLASWASEPSLNSSFSSSLRAVPGRSRRSPTPATLLQQPHLRRVPLFAPLELQPSAAPRFPELKPFPNYLAPFAAREARARAAAHDPSTAGSPSPDAL